MCGRFSIATDATVLKLRFNADIDTGRVLPAPRYNAAPSQLLPVIVNTDPKHIVALRWGIKPKWLSKISKKDGLINVRAETLREKRTFAGDLAARRCLVLADGFYEWQAVGRGPKHPYYIKLKSGEPFAFAGIWEENEGVRSFSIITTTPNDVLRSIHDRMPVILVKEFEKKWLDSDLKPTEALNFLTSYPAKEMRAYEVSTRVNDVRNDGKELVKKIN